MAFIQIIESFTEDPEAMQALTDEYEKASAGKGTARRSIVTRDRNHPNRYVVIVFFDSYESAMENSARPETQELAGKMSALVTAPPVFHDLDIIEDRSL
jgi:quinol monooxygenase YgiN